MRQIEWSIDALEDFEAAMGYIALDSEVAANTIADRLFDAVEQLGKLPTGRQGRVKGIYEKYVPGTSRIIAYAVIGQTITILRIVHASRDWRADEWPDE